MFLLLYYLDSFLQHCTLKGTKILWMTIILTQSKGLTGVVQGTFILVFLNIWLHSLMVLTKIFMSNFNRKKKNKNRPIFLFFLSNSITWCQFDTGLRQDWITDFCNLYSQRSKWCSMFSSTMQSAMLLFASIRGQGWFKIHRFISDLK